jgi:hypothetical protein
VNLPRKLPYLNEVIMEHNLFAVINNIKLSSDGNPLLSKMGNLGLPICHISNKEWLFVKPGDKTWATKCLSVIFNEECIKLHYFVLDRPQLIIESIALNLSKENFCRSGNFLPTAFLKHTLGQTEKLGIRIRKKALIHINPVSANQLQLAV